MKKKIKYILFVLILFIPAISFSQGIYVPVNNEIYSFLEKMDMKGLINYSDLVKPMSRESIASFLSELHAKQESLNRVERENLNWYSREYWYELNKSGIVEPEYKLVSLKKNMPSRFQFFRYSDKMVNLVFNPILGFEAQNKYNDLQYKRWGGASSYISFGEHFGAQMDFRDSWEKGDRIDRLKAFGPETGIQNIGGKGNVIEYSEIKGSVNFVSKYFDFSVGKEWFNWGSGYRSQLILSQKAPSFPYLRMDFKPLPWLRLYYIHGWLNSRVHDTSAYYQTSIYSDSTEIYRIIDRPKFYAAHILEITVKKRVRISIGESVVYSDQGPRIEFMIPVLFYRLVDHYNEGAHGFGRGSNSQFFADINVGLIKKTNLYSTLFIDEFSLSRFLKGDNSRNQLGYTIGSAAYDFLVPNLLVRIEYTRILPWVYSNFIQTQTYMNCNYLMGHYIGQNADQIFIQLSYNPIRGLNCNLWTEYIRRGGMYDVIEQYNDPGEDFLYGPLRKEFNLGMDISYEILHDLVGKIGFQYSDISDEDINRTPAYEIGSNTAIKFSVYYGL